MPIKKILIADDEAPVRKALKKAFEDKGYIVLLAEDGAEAIDILFKEKPALLILDWLMPKMYGKDVFDKLRQDEWGKNLPILILTNYSQDQTITERAKLPNTVLLTKNQTQIDDLLKIVKEKIG